MSLEKPNRWFENVSAMHLDFLNLRLNPDLNASSPADTDIAAADSAVRVLIIKSQENWQIAAESFEAWATA